MLHTTIINEMSELRAPPQWIYDTEYLVFSSGGTLGYSYLGCLLELDNAFQKQDRNLYRQIKGAAGCSIGASYALFVVLGIRQTQLWREVMNIDTTQLTDSLNVHNLTEMYGLNDKMYMQQKIYDLLERHTGNGNITFAELYRQTEKVLVCSTVNVSKAQAEYHSHLTTPHFRVVDSICASMSVPVIFTPSIINGDLYVDGALMANLPFTLFPIEKTFILHLLVSLPDISTLTNYIRRTILLAQSNIDEITMQTLPLEHRKRRLIIRLSGVHGLDFHITYEQKIALVQEGAKIIMRFLNPRLLVAECMKLLASTLFMMHRDDRAQSLDEDLSKTTISSPHHPKGATPVDPGVESEKTVLAFEQSCRVNDTQLQLKSIKEQ